MSDEDIATIGSDRMEPEAIPGQPATHSPFAEPSGIEPPRFRRTISAETRKAMEEAVAKLKADGGAQRDEDEFVAAVGEDTAEPAKGPGEVAVPPAAPPAPQLDADVVRLRGELEQRMGELDKREQAIVARETTGDVAKARETYIDKPAQWWRDTLKSFGLGELSDDEYKRETADLINELSDSIGVPITPATKAIMEQRRAVKYVRADKLTRQQRDKLEGETREKQRVDAEWANAALTLTAHLTTKEQAAYPWLATIDRPGEAVVAIIRRAAERDGKNLTWQEASKQANDYLRDQSLTSYDKVKHLLSAAPAKPGDAAGAAAQGKPQGDPSGIRRSRTLSNAQAASTPTQPQPTAVVDGKWSREAHRRNTLAAFKERFKPDE